MVVIICGHGKPSSKRIYNALKDHIKEGSTVIHDEDYLRSMAMINNMCG